MHALAQHISLPCLDSVIDYAPLTIAAEETLSDAVALINEFQPRTGCLLVLDNRQVVGLLTEQDIVQIAFSDVNFKTVKIFEVMKTTVVLRKPSEILNNIVSVLTFLRLHHLPVLPVVDEEERLIGVISHESICQSLEREGQKTCELDEIQAQLSLLISAVVNANDAIIIIKKVHVSDKPLCLQKNYVIDYVNEAFTDMSGILGSNVIGKTLGILYGEKTSGSELEKIEAALVSESSIKTKLINYHNNGSTYWVEVNIAPIPDVGGKITHFVCIQRDISEHKQAEENLLEAKQQLQAVIDAVPGFVSWVSEDGRYLGVNRRLAESLNLTTDEFVDRPVGFMQTNPEIANFIRNFSATPNVAASHIFDMQVYGTTRNYLIAAHKYQQGKAAVLVGIDVTETKQVEIELQQARADLVKANLELETRVEERTKALREMNRQLVYEIADRQLVEEQLRQSQEMLQLIMDNIPQCVFWKDTASVFLGCNRNFAKLAGFDNPEDIIGKTDYDLVSVMEEANSSREADTKVMETNKPEYHSVIPHLQKDGTQVWLEVNRVPFHDAEGKVMGVLGTFEDITPRKQAQEALEESKERFRFLAESIPQQVWLAKPDGNLEYVNQRMLNYFGCTQEEFLLSGWQQFLHPEDLPRCLALWNKSVTTGEPYEFEFRLLSATDLTYRWHLSRGIPLRDEEGQILNWFGTNTDIHDYKQAEESLQLRDRAIAASRNGIVIADVTMPGFPVIYANQAFEQITGYSVDEVIGKNCQFLQGADTNQVGLVELRNAISQGKGCTVVLRNYRKDGSLFWNELSISPVHDCNHKLTHYIGIQTDITERQRAEVALLVSQERLQYLLYSTPGVIYSCKPSGDFGTTFISENVTSILGYEAREFLEDSSFWINHIHPDDLQRVLADAEKVDEQAQIIYEYRYLHKDGTYRWMYDRGKLVLDDTGNPLEIVGYWIDITKRKLLEEELKIALEKEKELNDLKTRFIAMTSHEFRTPLSTILSSSELLEHYRHKWTEEKQLSHLHRIQNAVHHMTEMLNNVLLIGKTEAGKLSFVGENFDLVEYCQYLVEELQLNVNSSHIIHFSSSKESIRCCMDKKLLGHILSNLLSNAIKYSPSSGVVQFTLKFENDRAIFEIQDRGIGIPPEDQPHIFESFHRATNVGNIQGTGLGLAIVKKCVELYKGDITLSSNVGVGTTFSVSLPINNQS
ncbi:hypothetical protein NUACC21_50370 [Scytonema sp. NUACC21]